MKTILVAICVFALAGCDDGSNIVRWDGGGGGTLAMDAASTRPSADSGTTTPSADSGTTTPTVCDVALEFPRSRNKQNLEQPPMSAIIDRRRHRERHG